MSQPKPKLCMIVKDESKVIERSLDSAMPYVDGVYIHDTGSTDNTVELIKNHPIWTEDSEVVSEPWVGFAHNRSALLNGTRERYDGNGYFLSHDADDVFLPPPEGWEWPKLTHAGYMLKLKSGGMQWWRTVLFNAEYEWKYKGVWHSVAFLEGERNEIPQLQWPIIEPHYDGHKTETSHNDARYIRVAGDLHAEWLETNSNRALYYAAQSYRDAGEFWMAAKLYNKRAELDGWPEEKWHSTFMTGVMALKTETPYSAEKMFLDAIDLRPCRMEPYVALAAYYRKKDKPAKSRPYAQVAAQTNRIPEEDITFVDISCFGGWKAVDEYSLALYGIGEPFMAISMMEALEQRADLPDREKKRVRDNIEVTRRNLPRTRGK